MIRVFPFGFQKTNISGDLNGGAEEGVRGAELHRFRKIVASTHLPTGATLLPVRAGGVKLENIGWASAG